MSKKKRIVSKANYILGPLDLSMMEFIERGLSLIPSFQTFTPGKQRLKLHNQMLSDEECHRYAGLLYCFCGDCK